MFLVCSTSCSGGLIIFQCFWFVAHLVLMNHFQLLGSTINCCLEEGKKKKKKKTCEVYQNPFWIILLTLGLKSLGSKSLSVAMWRASKLCIFCLVPILLLSWSLISYKFLQQFLLACDFFASYLESFETLLIDDPVLKWKLNSFKKRSRN